MGRLKTALDRVPFRVRLIVFALLCTVPLVVLTALALRADLKWLEAESRRQAEDRIQQFQRDLEHTLDTAESLAGLIGGLELSTRLPQEVCSGALSGAVRATRTRVMNVAVLSAQGEILCSAVVLPAGARVAQRDYVQRALATGRTAVSDHTRGLASGRDALHVAVPIVRSGGVQAVVVVTIAAASLMDLLEPRPPMEVVLFDRKGVLLGRHDGGSGPIAGATAIGQSWVGAPVLSAVQRQQNLWLDDGRGRSRLHLVRGVQLDGETVLGIAARLERDSVPDALRARRWRDFALVMALVGGVGVSALLLLRPLVLTRLQRLAELAQRASQGQLDARVPVTALDELTPVEEALNQLLAAVQAERAQLAASENRYRQLFATSRDALLHTRIDGTILAANPAAEALFGWSSEELCARVRQDLVDPTDARLQPLLAQRLRTGSAGGELRMRRRDGSVFEAEVASSASTDPQAMPTTWVVVRDVSERVRAEREVLRLNQELEQRVRQRTLELEEANRELEAFSYSVSHDLRAPLQAVRSFAQLLEQRGDIADPKGRHYLDRIRLAAERMTDLIQGLLELAQLKRTQLRLAPVNLSALAAEVVQELREGEPERAVQVHIAPGLSATADARLLRVVLVNLLGNAFKFTRPQAEPAVWLEAVPDAPATFVVRDNGVGFDPAFAGRLFEAFTRLHGAHEFPGVGIGLASVQRVVQRHGGRLWAESAPGQGARFYFSLAPQAVAG